MNDRPFKEKSQKPTNENLQKVLGVVFKYYVDLIKVTTIFSHNWNYSKSSGWMEKVADNKKALYYLIPLKGSFIISMAIRETEKEYILSDKNLERYADIVSTAKKYSEGFNVKFEVTDAASYKNSKDFVDIIISIRLK